MSQYSNDFEKKMISWEGCLHFVAKYYSITSFEGWGCGVWPIYYSILHRVLRNICTAPYIIEAKCQNVLTWEVQQIYVSTLDILACNDVELFSSNFNTFFYYHFMLFKPYCAYHFWLARQFMYLSTCSISSYLNQSFVS